MAYPQTSSRPKGSVCHGKQPRLSPGGVFKRESSCHALPANWGSYPVLARIFVLLILILTPDFVPGYRSCLTIGIACLVFVVLLLTLTYLTKIRNLVLWPDTYWPISWQSSLGLFLTMLLPPICDYYGDHDKKNPTGKVHTPSWSLGWKIRTFQSQTFTVYRQDTIKEERREMCMRNHLSVWCSFGTDDPCSRAGTFMPYPVDMH